MEDSEAIESKLKTFLHEQFQTIKLPPFIQALSVSSLKLGSKPPEITIRHISDPFPEFYEGDDEDELDLSDHEPNHSPTESRLDRESPSSTVADRGSPGSESPEPLPGLMSPTRGPPSVPFGRSSMSSGSLNYSRLGRILSPPPNLYSSPDLSEDLSDLRDRSPPSRQSEAEPELHDHSEILDSLLEEETSPFDIQALVEFQYSGDMQLGVTATLLVNYPSPSFISLPLSFEITGIEIHTLAVMASIKNRVHFSILCDIDANDQMLSDDVMVIRSLKMDSKIGDYSEHGAVLRNVGKVERFILEQLRKVVRDELVWPGWITLEL